MCASMGECCVHVDPYVKIQLRRRVSKILFVYAEFQIESGDGLT